MHYRQPLVRFFFVIKVLFLYLVELGSWEYRGCKWELLKAKNPNKYIKQLLLLHSETAFFSVKLISLPYFNKTRLWRLDYKINKASSVLLDLHYSSVFFKYLMDIPDVYIIFILPTDVRKVVKHNKFQFVCGCFGVSPF